MSGTNPGLPGAGGAGGGDEVARLEAMLGALERDSRQAEAERAERDAQRAVEARAGRLGSDWQEVQRRIDAGESSVADVFTGRDETPAAKRLVELSQRNLTELGRLAQEDDELRAELADLNAETAQWESPAPVTAPITAIDDRTGADDGASGVRSATDPTTGAVADGAAAGADTPLDSGAARPSAPARPEQPTRDPVADRVDATGLEPEAPRPPSPDDAPNDAPNESPNETPEDPEDRP